MELRDFHETEPRLKPCPSCGLGAASIGTRVYCDGGTNRIGCGTQVMAASYKEAERIWNSWPRKDDAPSTDRVAIILTNFQAKGLLFDLRQSSYLGSDLFVLRNILSERYGS